MCMLQQIVCVAAAMLVALTSGPVTPHIHGLSLSSSVDRSNQARQLESSKMQSQHSCTTQSNGRLCRLKPSPVHGCTFRRVVTVRPLAQQKGFGKTKPARQQVEKKPQPQASKPVAKPAVKKVATAGGAAPMGFTATPEQLKDGFWNDNVVPNVLEFFDKAGKDVKAVTLAAGRTLVLYRHNNTVYCSDVNSTAYQFPMVDAVLGEGQDGPTVTVPLDGTVYDLRTGKVLKWCPASDNAVKNFFATLKRSTAPVNLTVYPTHVTEAGMLRVRL